MGINLGFKGLNTGMAVLQSCFMLAHCIAQLSTAKHIC